MVSQVQQPTYSRFVHRSPRHRAQPHGGAEEIHVLRHNAGVHGGHQLHTLSGHFKTGQVRHEEQNHRECLYEVLCPCRRGRPGEHFPMVALDHRLQSMTLREVQEHAFIGEHIHIDVLLVQCRRSRTPSFLRTVDAIGCPYHIRQVTKAEFLRRTFTHRHTVGESFHHCSSPGLVRFGKLYFLQILCFGQCHAAHCHSSHNQFLHRSFVFIRRRI